MVRNTPCEEVDALRLMFVFVLEVHFYGLPQGAEDISASLTPEAQSPPGEAGTQGLEVPRTVKGKFFSDVCLWLGGGLQRATSR